MCLTSRPLLKDGIKPFLSLEKIQIPRGMLKSNQGGEGETSGVRTPLYFLSQRSSKFVLPRTSKNIEADEA
jgi:hypothetical protein